MNTGIFLLFLISLSYILGAQPAFKPAVVTFRKTAVNAYIDRPGDVYIQFEDGTISKYDNNGKPLETFHPKESIEVFEPRDGARAFMFSQKGNWYSYAYFGNINKSAVAEEFAIEPWLVCSSGDKNYWILDVADFSLKRINTLLHKVETEFILPAALRTGSADFLLIREYMGFIFVLHQTTGISIFNSMGKHLKTLPGKGIRYFNFIGEELYYPLNNKLHFYDLFDASTSQQEFTPAAKFIMLTDERRYAIFPDRMEISSLPN